MNPTTPEPVDRDATPGAPPALLEWARATFSEEEAVAGLREIRATGGLSLDQLLAGLGEPDGPRE